MGDVEVEARIRAATDAVVDLLDPLTGEEQLCVAFAVAATVVTAHGVTTDTALEMLEDTLAESARVTEEAS